MAKKTSTPSFTPQSSEQEAAVRAIQDNDIVFITGDAGTGKTHIAVAMAAEALRIGTHAKIVVCRPAVESGEHLGFLPGTFEEKIDPFLASVMILLQEFKGDICDDRIKNKMMREDLIEKVAFAHMRGRTFTDRFVILDEAQNTTPSQMKMALTRLGKGSKIVITGDVRQCDLPGRSGLMDALDRLQGVANIAFVELTAEVSNQRHPSVADIIKAYDR